MTCDAMKKKYDDIAEGGRKEHPKAVKALYTKKGLITIRRGLHRYQGRSATVPIWPKKRKECRERNGVLPPKKKGPGNLPAGPEKGVVMLARWEKAEKKGTRRGKKKQPSSAGPEGGGALFAHAKREGRLISDFEKPIAVE